MGRKKRGRKPKPPEEVELPDDKKANTTDPESQTLKTSTGWVQGYNGQAMVDCDHQIIITQDITTDANDVQQLEPMLEKCEEVNGKRPEKALADAGYWSHENAQLRPSRRSYSLRRPKTGNAERNSGRRIRLAGGSLTHMG